jgi:alkylation response protein AidB-like acyl-CoA dehydrogenase
MTSTVDDTGIAAPTSHEQWLDQAGEVATALAGDVVERERTGVSPTAEVGKLRESGLLTMLGPVDAGGGGAGWDTALAVTRRIAMVDGSVAQLLGYHYLWVSMPTLWGTAEQRRRLDEDTTRNRWFWAAAVNPRDNDVRVRDLGDELAFEGRKSFSTGARIADRLVLEGVVVDSDGVPGEHRVFGMVAGDDPGLARNDDWDNVGMRLTESGSVDIRDVRVPWSDALGYTDKIQEVPPQAALTTVIHQLVFTNLYLGLAQGALAAARHYTRSTTRPWLNAVNVEHATDDPYTLRTYGELGAALLATEALVDRANDRLSAACLAPDAITERSRGELMVLVAASKAQTTQVALDTTSRVFEVTGARATAAAVGLDRFWRDVRTHTLHDPVAYKLREVGDYTLNDRIPTPGWYS